MNNRLHQNNLDHEDEINITSQDLPLLAEQLNVSYLYLLLYIWFNRKDLTTDGIIKIRATDTRGYNYKYNSFGNKIGDELDNILHGAKWEYIGADIYAVDSNKRTGKSKLVLTLPNKRIVLTSSKPFDPKITIAGARIK